MRTLHNSAIASDASAHGVGREPGDVEDEPEHVIYAVHANSVEQFRTSVELVPHLRAVHVGTPSLLHRPQEASAAVVRSRPPMSACSAASRCSGCTFDAVTRPPRADAHAKTLRRPTRTDLRRGGSHQPSSWVKALGGRTPRISYQSGTWSRRVGGRTGIMAPTTMVPNATSRSAGCQRSRHVELVVGGVTSPSCAALPFRSILITVHVDDD